MKRLMFAGAVSLAALLILSPALFAQDTGDMPAPPAYGSSEGGDSQPSAAPDDNTEEAAPDTDMQSPDSDSNPEAQSPDSQNPSDDTDQPAPQQYEGGQNSSQGDSY